jgi:Fic family protein
MSNLERYIHSDDIALDPLILCYIVHYQFEAIHPFSDGNGRVGRALLALMIYKWLRHAMPWLYMSAYFEKYKDEYTDKLFKISTEGDWDGWIEFCLNGTIVQARSSIRRCDQFKQLRTELHGRVKSGTPRTHKIIESFFEKPIVNIPRIVKIFGITYKTAQRDVELLLAAGVLQEIPNRHPRSFFVGDLMRIAYGDDDVELQPNMVADSAKVSRAELDSSN